MWFNNFVIILFSATLCLAEPSEIVRPCNLKDYKCMGDNLAANSQCNRNVKRMIPREYRIDTHHFETPAFNASYIDTNLFVRNENKCKVAEFFFNTKTDRVVLGIECENMELESDRAYIQHRTFQEDSYYSYHIKALYPLLRFTVNLPSLTHLDLCTASIYSDVAKLPKLQIDPKSKSTAKTLSRDLSLLNIYERENFLARGKSIVYLFIDSMICDYSCRLST